MDIPINGGIKEGHETNSVSGKALVKLGKSWPLRQGAQ